MEDWVNVVGLVVELDGLPNAVALPQAVPLLVSDKVGKLGTDEGGTGAKLGCNEVEVVWWVEVVVDDVDDESLPRPGRRLLGFTAIVKAGPDCEMVLPVLGSTTTVFGVAYSVEVEMGEPE